MMFVEVLGTILIWLIILFVFPLMLRVAYQLIVQGIQALLTEHRRTKYKCDVTVIGTGKRYQQ